MHIVRDEHIPPSFHAARSLEQKGEVEKAAVMYEGLLKDPGNRLVILARLIIIYRKLKQPKKEIAAIDRSIALYEQQYLAGKNKTAGVNRISKKLNMALGHVDKKGRAIIAAPEVEKLKKRKEMLMAKL